MSTVYHIVAKQAHESIEEAIARVYGEEFFDDSADSWDPPVDEGEWQSGWRKRVVAVLMEIHEWDIEEDDRWTILWRQDYAWQIEVFSGSAAMRFRKQREAEECEIIDGKVLEVFAEAGAILLTPDQDQWWDLKDAGSPRDLS